MTGYSEIKHKHIHREKENYFWLVAVTQKSLLPSYIPFTIQKKNNKSCHFYNTSITFLAILKQNIMEMTLCAV